MRKILCTVCLLFIVCGMIIGDEISIRADEWMPHNGIPGSDKPGYMIEIAQVIFGKKGHTVDYAIFPWNRAVKQARKGKINAVVGAFKTDTPDFIFPDMEQGVSKLAFFVKKGTEWKYTGVDSFKSIILGVIDAYSYGEEIDKYVKDNEESEKLTVIFGEEALEQSVKMLLSDRITVFVEDAAVMQHYLNKINNQEIVLAGLVGSEEYTPDDYIYISFSPKNPKSKEYAKILSDGMKELRASGELEAILKKYGFSDWR